MLLRSLAHTAVVGISSASLAATVSVDTASVIAGQSNQPITFSVTGGESAGGMTFFLELLDGTGLAPTLNDSASVDLISGSIWSGKAPTQTENALLAYAYSGSVDSDNTVLNGTFATIYVDASGLLPGETFSVSLLNVLDPSNDTFFSAPGGLSQIDITGETFATLTAVVPEPATLGILALASGVLVRRRRA